MPTRTAPLLAKSIESTPSSLIIITESGRFDIPRLECSERLARATDFERTRMELSPSGYGIHWPLIDEDLAVGTLIFSRR